MKRVVLITGAGQGIGYEFGKILAERGDDLILTDVDQVGLQKAAKTFQDMGCTVSTIVADLSKQEEVDGLINQIDRLNKPIDMLINNAGFGDFGSFVDRPLDRNIDMINLNVVALTHLTHAFANRMRARHTGKILNVASTASFQPTPLFAAYAATKAYVLYLTEALNYELNGSGVTATALCPGPTRTGFQKTADMGSSFLFDGVLTLKPQVVAQIGIEATLAGKPVVIVGGINKFLAFLVRLFPRKLVLPISKWLLTRKKAPH